MQWLTLAVNLAATLGIGGGLLGLVRWVKSKNAPSVAETWNRLTATALEEAEKRAAKAKADSDRHSHEQDQKIAFCERRCYLLMAGWEDEIDAHDALLSQLAARSLIDTGPLEASLTSRRDRLREAKRLHYEGPNPPAATPTG